MCGVLDECHSIRLKAFLSFNDVELDLIALFQRLVSTQLNCRIVDKYVRPVFTSDESVAFCIVKPLTLAYAKRSDCPVLFVSGDSTFHDGDKVALEILEDIKREQVDVRVFRSIGALITDGSPEPTPISAERAEELLDSESLGQPIISTARDALNLRYSGPWRSTKYGHGDMQLVSIRFSAGSLYVVDSSTNFAEITYEVELSWSETRSYPFQNQQDALAALASGYSQSTMFAQPVATPSNAFAAPIGLPGFMGVSLLTQTEPYAERERISSEVLVFARIEKGKLKSFEVHEVTIKSIKHEPSHPGRGEE